MGAKQSKVGESVQDDLHDATMKEVALGHCMDLRTGGYRTLWIFFLCADHAQGSVLTCEEAV